MKTETKENIANWAYPLAMATTFGALEYFGVGNSLREFELDKLALKQDFYGTLNPIYWGEYINAYWKPIVLEGLASGVAGGLAGACIAEPIKKLINRRK